MNTAPYLYDKSLSTHYRFISIGRRRIEKVVEFTPLDKENFYNLGFGDLLSNGRVDDKVNTNNGDIVKVLSTIIHIVKDFTADKPQSKIAFKGSTLERTKLYQRILRTYSETFSREFFITALTGPPINPEETIFDPRYQGVYLAFFVKRKT